MTAFVLLAAPAHALTRCDLRFELEGWSIFYKEATGAGVVRCDNGQQARVELESVRAEPPEVRDEPIEDEDIPARDPVPTGGY
jgi:hypothetical protein